MSTIGEAVKHLKGYKRGNHVCMILWSTEDVITRAEERDIQLTQEQADRIIDKVDRKQDASVGVTWDTIDFYTDNILAEDAGQK